jgi:hypothetical protein
MMQILYAAALGFLSGAGFSLLQAPEWRLDASTLLLLSILSFAVGTWIERVRTPAGRLDIGWGIAYFMLCIVLLTAAFYMFVGPEVDARAYEASHAAAWTRIGRQAGSTPQDTQAVAVSLFRKKDSVTRLKVAVIHRRGFSIEDVSVSEVWNPHIVRASALKQPIVIKGEGVSWGSTLPEFFTPKAGFVEREFQLDSLAPNLQLAVVVQYYSIKRGGWPVERFHNVAGMFHARFKIPE